MHLQRGLRRSASGTQCLQQGFQGRHVEEETTGGGAANRLQGVVIVVCPQREPRSLVRKVNAAVAAQADALRYETPAQFARQATRPVANTKDVQWKGEQPLQQLAVAGWIEPFHAEPRHEIDSRCRLRSCHGTRKCLALGFRQLRVEQLFMMFGTKFREQDLAPGAKPLRLGCGPGRGVPVRLGADASNPVPGPLRHANSRSRRAAQTLRPDA